MRLACVQASEEPISGFAGEVVLHAGVVTLLRPNCAGFAVRSLPCVYSSTYRTSVPFKPVCSWLLNVVTIVLIRPRVCASCNRANGDWLASGKLITATKRAPLATTCVL